MWSEHHTIPSVSSDLTIAVFNCPGLLFASTRIAVQFTDYDYPFGIFKLFFISIHIRRDWR
jgi:hypothetical protein